MTDPEAFEWIRLIWTDVNGVARAIAIPAERYEHAASEGVGFANGVVEYTLEPGLLDDPAYGPEGGDMLAVPDRDSLVPLEWREDTGAAFCDLTDVDGEPFALCARGVLRRVVDRLERAGYRPRVGVETEFSLLAPDGDGGWEPFNDRSSYDLDAIDGATEQIDAWRSALEAAGREVIGVHHESQPGQFEVNVRHDDALSTADGIALFRHVVKSVARDGGLKATLMPRPHRGEDANGMHLHLSLWDGEGKNLFAGTGDLAFPAGKHPEDGDLSGTGRHFVGGLLEHMGALTAVCAPTVNSYKRLLPGIWAPVNVAWGPDNRSTVIRIPPELGDAARVEHRVPDTAANPYLALAATLAAGLDGIENGTDPGAPTHGNAYEEDHERLPRTLPAAVDHLDRNDVLRDALGDVLVDEFVKLKRDEFDRYQEHITEWEVREYRDEF